MAWIAPSEEAPTRTRTWEPAVGPVPTSTSSRDMTILTGRPVFFESRAATGSRYTGILPPKPPPISIGVTLMFDTGISRILAVTSRTTKAPCVEHQICRRPSWFQRAVTLCGSM